MGNLSLWFNCYPQQQSGPQHDVAGFWVRIKALANLTATWAIMDSAPRLVPESKSLNNASDFYYDRDSNLRCSEK
jgi:hypothetical protein